MTFRVTLAMLAMLALTSTACSDAPPLGGPHGGQAVVVAPRMGYVDASTYTPPEPPPPPAGGDPGTWNHIWSAYFAKGTVGDCPLCHSEMNTPKASYDWMRELEYIGTQPVALTDYGASCLAWFGGSMPIGLVPKNDAIVAEFEAWAKAGAKFD